MPRRVEYAKSTVDSDKKRTIYKPLKYPEIPSSLVTKISGFSILLVLQNNSVNI